MITLSPRQFGEAIGVSESSVKRWADDGELTVERTGGGHRRITLAEAVRFVRQSGLSVIKPQVLGLVELADDTGPAQRATGDPASATAHRLRAALIDGRAAEVRAIVLSSYLGGSSVAALCDGPLRAAMTHIGNLWRHGSDGIFIEHRASDLIAQALYQLRCLLPPPATDAPVAVGGAPDGDIYVLPSLMAAATLASVGWREINLGHDTPLGVIAEAAERYDAALVWLAVSVERPAEPLIADAARLAARLAADGRTLIAGGRGWPRRVRLKSPNAHAARSMADLERLAFSLHKPHGLDAA